MKYLFSSIDGIENTKAQMIVGYIDSVICFLLQNEESLKIYYTASKKRVIEDKQISLFIQARDELQNNIKKIDLQNDINQI